MSDSLFSLDPRSLGDGSVEFLLGLARECGLTGVEWSALNSDDLRRIPNFTATQSLVTLRAPLSDLRDRDDVELVRDAIAAAAERECPLVVGPAGNPAEASRRPDALKRLRSIGETARAAGVTYAVETGPGLCRSHRTMVDLLHDLGDSGIRLSFDPVMLHACNEYLNSEVALARTCHAVSHVRIGDCSGDEGDTRRLPLGQGVVDFVRMGQLLRVCGFRGPYCLGLPAALRSEPEIAEWVRSAVGYLRQCGVR